VLIGDVLDGKLLRLEQLRAQRALVVAVLHGDVGLRPSCGWGGRRGRLLAGCSGGGRRYRYDVFWLAQGAVLAAEP
jgi:hypothetical protein